MLSESFPRVIVGKSTKVVLIVGVVVLDSQLLTLTWRRNISGHLVIGQTCESETNCSTLFPFTRWVPP